MYYDRQGNQIDMNGWMRLYEEHGIEYKRVAYDQINDVVVSTVWLGMDLSWDDGPPLIFETMIFGGAYDDDQWRYSTEAEAREGHAHAVRLVRGSEP